MKVLSILLVFYWAIILEINAASTSPIVSLFGDNFRSGEVTVSIGTDQYYVYQIPYSSSLPSEAISTALSVVDYKQTFSTNNRIMFEVIENTPSMSNSTHNIFTVYIGFTANTVKTKVKYLACLTSQISSNFRILSTKYYPGAVVACCINAYFVV
jgi:hypothetical protein